MALLHRSAQMVIVPICDKVQRFQPATDRLTARWAGAAASQRPQPRCTAAMPQHPFKPLPLGAALLAGSLTAAPTFAQTPPAGANTPTLSTVEVRDQAIGTDSKTTLKATETSIGKGKQAIRDIPQSVTVMTERLLD